VKRIFGTSLLFSFLLLSKHSFGQKDKFSVTFQPKDSLYLVLEAAKEDTNKARKLDMLARSYLYRGNFHLADSLAECALQLSGEIEFKRGQINAYEIIGLVYLNQGNYMLARKNQLTALKISEDIGDKFHMASSYNNLGLAYASQGDYPDATKNYFNALKISQEIKDIGSIINASGNIGNIYIEQGNYTEALKYELLVLKMSVEPGGDRQLMGNAYANIGNIYLEQGNYKEALRNQLLGLNIDIEVGNKPIMGLAYGNIGSIYGDQKIYNVAIKYYLLGLKIDRELGNKHAIATAYSNVGEVFTKQKKMTDAIKYLDSALYLSKATDSKDVIRDTYINKALWDSLMGNYKAAYIDYAQSIVYRDSLKNEEYTRKIMSEQMNYEFDKKIADEKAEQEKQEIIKSAENKRKTTIVYSVVVLIIVSSAFIVNGQRVKRNKEKDIMRLEKLRIEDELGNAKKMLRDYTHSMVEKNELLERFQIEIEKLKNNQSVEVDKLKLEQLENLNSASILTEADWGKFKLLFEQVYSGFFVRLKDKMPDLTQSETRLICLTKLKLGDKQMAAILGVSHSTIKITRYRLRRKMGLTEENSIDDIADSI